MIPAYFQLDAKPHAHAEAIIEAGNARFTVLTERLIRLQYAADDQFEDRPSQAIWYREQPVPLFSVKQTEHSVVIETSAFVLAYNVGERFNADNLTIHVKATKSNWVPRLVDEHNLKGTTRTLDYINGYAPLNEGLISRAGWSLLDDSLTFVFNEQDWLTPREGGIDWYFFAYGHDYKAGLRDYTAVSGGIPLIPRWILGNWWSRYWAYTQEELTALIHDAQAHGFPFSIVIIDMDWHIVETGNASRGWTGYTWNKNLFPDPQAMLDFIHEKGLRTALNLHPADGVYPHEEQYEAMARRMGIDPATQAPVPFDITDPEFMQAYFEILHHPYEEMGVDFWWIDWQQGVKSKIEKLDPLWFLNHLHFHDMKRDPSRRPFIFSRWGREGHQRYPIGFSGDSYRTWETLRFQPYMTATASNVAYGWWSHDIGGHVSGVGDEELFARWVQFGTFSPIQRLHTTTGAYYDQRPWTFENAEIYNVLKDALQLRHALIPYLYTMARRASTESLPLMLPMYYDYPERDEAYHCPGQYQFGTELIAAPFTDPVDPDTRLARQVVWLPEGDWVHAFTGEYYAGDRWHAIYGTLKEIPVFAKAGAILPLAPKPEWDAIDNPAALHLHIYAGADGAFTLYEDDGDSLDYVNGDYALTTITQTWHGDSLTVRLHPAEGHAALLPAERAIQLHIHSVSEAVRVQAESDGTSVIQRVHSRYDAHTETLLIDGLTLTPTSGLTVTVESQGEALLSRRDRKRENVLLMLRRFHLHTGIRNTLAAMVDDLLRDPDHIAPYLLPMKPAHIRALCEVLYEAGVHYTIDSHHPTQLVLWNNREDERITYRYADAYLNFGHMRSSHHHHGVVPRYLAITPKMTVWTHGMLQENIRRTQWHIHMDYHNLADVIEEYREETP